MPSTPSSPVRPATTLFVARVVYAFNWYNIGAVLPLVGASIGAGTAALGLILGAFLVGVGLFQIPAGIAALRWGARRVSLFGLILMGGSCLASAFFPTLDGLIVTRFIAGVGAAFFFSPGLSLISSYYSEARRGPVIGLYNGGFSLGGAAGLVGGLYLGTMFGWPAALAVGGAALLAMGLIAIRLLPLEDEGRHRRATVRELLRESRPTLSSRSIWALALALTGFWGAVYAVAQYFIDFADKARPDWAPAAVGALVASFVVMSFPGGPVGGWIADRGYDRRLVVGVAGVVASALVLVIGWTSFTSVWPVLLLLGFVDGIVFAVLYLIPSYLPESRGSSLALGVALINSIQVALGASLAIAFGFIAERTGYTWAWVFAGVTSFALLPLLFWVRANRADPTARTRSRTSGAAPGPAGP